MEHDNWIDGLSDALAGVTPENIQLYAGDERLRHARAQQAGRAGMRKAGVLMPIISADEPQLVLTQRSNHLRSHPGQISFPGGRVEPGDRDVEAAAIREANEEIGLQPGDVRTLGRLPDYVTGTGYDIAPFVALIPVATRIVPDGQEVTRVFNVPLAHILDPTIYRRDMIPIDGVDYEFHVVEYNGNYIWGATAAMLYGLCRSVSALVHEPDSASD